MRNRLFAACLAAALTIIAMSAMATIVVTEDNGGLISDYKQSLREIIKSREHVVLDGPCVSACTLILTMPANRLCATSRASLGVHLSWFVDRRGRVRNGSQSTTERDLGYSRALRAWIRRHGGLRSDPKYISGAALRRFVHPC